jgi:acyl-[acyl-carrier-protein]-phospholipid O-acyltransferase/long-chain-fatty-acid--[acyl-carrier-protein] ligase
MTATQFLGAFNDNLFKQLVLLICLDYVALRSLESDPYQAWAQGMFSLPFVLFSGFAGWLSDRNSKRTIVVFSKVAEIVVMAAGLALFLTLDFGTDGYLVGLIAVLFLMGAQSAYFGPAKYGILPEMLRDSDLPLANGLVQMTTFLAIIFGTAVCGFFKNALGDSPRSLALISAACVGIAVVGTFTSLLVRRTPIAAPGLRFRLQSLAVDPPTVQMLRRDRPLLAALGATVLFWFLGGACLPIVNTLGKEQLGLGDAVTSLLTASIGLGIAAGCAGAGLASRRRLRFGLVRGGAWGMALLFCLLGALPQWASSSGLSPRATSLLLAVFLVGLGISAGIYAVPLQVFLQSRPPREQKGRMIATMNICTWLGVFASAFFYHVCSGAFTNQHIARTFYVLAAFSLPIALLYRQQDLTLTDE